MTNPMIADLVGSAGRLPSVSVVIPNYNGRQLLEANLPLVKEMLRVSRVVDGEIVVSDDASSDDSVAFLRENHPDVRLVVGESNLGFSGNVNRGIRAACKQLVLILNSDVEVSPDYLVPQFRYFERPDTFGVMGRIDSGDGNRLRGGAKYPRLGFASIKSTGNYLRTDPADRAESLSLYLSGANVLVNRSKLLELDELCGLFNPYNSEDVDLGLRAWRLGYRCYYEVAATCRHASSATIRKQPPERVLCVALRNKILLHYLHLDGLSRAVYLVRQVAKSVLLLLLGRSIQWRALRDFVAMLPAARTERSRFESLQRAKGLGTRTGDVRRTILDSLRGARIRRF